jgi:hypothetical protein
VNTHAIFYVYTVLLYAFVKYNDSLVFYHWYNMDNIGELPSWGRNLINLNVNAGTKLSELVVINVWYDVRYLMC